MEENMDQAHDEPPDPDPPSTIEPADPSDDFTRSFVRLSNLPTFPLEAEPV
jgi:hypothetical protein